jgi:glycerol kinase
LADPLYLCLDQGGHASRAIVFDARGEMHAQAFHPIVTQRNDNYIEHAPEQITATLQAAADDVVKELGERAEQIVAAGLATQRSSIVCWHRETGAALSPVISWQDTRAANWLEQFAEHEPEVHATTGLMLSPHYGVSKLRWCLENLPAVEKAYADGQLIFGPLAAFVVNQMLVAHPLLTDPANASRTLLWDRMRRDWSPDLLKLFSIPQKCLPVCVPSRHAWGDLDVAGRRIPVTVVTGDQSAALFAFGEPGLDRIAANLGTGAFLQQSVGNTILDPGRLLASVVYQSADSLVSVFEGTVNGAGSAINALCDELGVERDYMRAHSADWLRSADASGHLPLFVNSISGLGSPWWMSDVDSHFVGDGSVEQKIAAVMESVVFLLTVNIKTMQDLGKSSDYLLVTGGLGSVAPLLQRIANLTGMTVQRPEVSEATARGLAFLLADMPEDWPAAKVSAEFKAQDDSALKKRFQRWLDAMPKIPG